MSNKKCFKCGKTDKLKPLLETYICDDCLDEEMRNWFCDVLRGIIRQQRDKEKKGVKP